MSKQKVKFTDRDPNAPHFSSWLITINTNSVDKRLIVPLRKTWQYIIENISKFLTSSVPGAYLIDVGERSNVEIGDEKHRIHLHSKLIIETAGRSNLNYSEIKKFINKQLDRFDTFKGAHFSADLVRNFNASVVIGRYVEKGENIDADDDEFEIIE